MRELIKRIPPSTLIVSAVVFALLGFQAYAMRPVQPQGPTTVAMINVQKVWDSLERTKQVQAELRTLEQAFDAEQQEKRAHIQRLEQDLSLFTPGTPAYREAEEELLLEVQRYAAWTAIEQQELQTISGDRVREVFNEIRESAAQLSAREGYDMILMDDTVSPIDGRTQEEVNRQISARRILHANPQLDVTQQLVDFMNP